jgi:hypothetical protein
MAKRIGAIVFIYICVTVAWLILGGTMTFRTYNMEPTLHANVGELWGNPLYQQGPTVTYQLPQVNNEGITVYGPTQDTQFETSNIAVNLDLDYRLKGLLWYSTYRVRFSGAYVVVNDSDEPWQVSFTFPLPDDTAIYDEFHVVVGETEVANISMYKGQVVREFELPPGQRQTVTVNYGSQGMDEWWYILGTNVTQAKNFSLVMTTDFSQIDFPQDSMSPVQKEEIPGGWKLTWSYGSLLSGRPIAMTMPKLLNPGPWASKVIFFAPVSLLLFFFLLFLFTTVRNVKVHPMNYFFIGTAFFAYHLLLAYLVDHISIHLAFWICSAVSIFLVVSYMRLAVGARFALVEVGISQFVYLVLFSYTFFFEGYTGLVITIMCIITLFVVMQFTGRIDWETAFRKGQGGKGKELPIPAAVLAHSAPGTSEPGGTGKGGQEIG